MNSCASAPLEGIRILDFTNMMVGPYCTRLLADMGAEVIKVEPPSGDHNRTRRPVRGLYSSFFGHLNCGKLSVMLNLKSREGQLAAAGLAKHSDVVVENWRPGVADRLGIGYAALSAAKPDIIYCAISGFGQKGPKAGDPAYAPIVHAASGFDLAQVEYQGGGKPANTGTFIADMFGGMAAFGAIQTALLRKAMRGDGQFIDVSLFDGMLNLMVSEFQEAQFPSSKKLRFYQPSQTKDGYVVIAPTSQRNFEQLARAVGHPEWIDDQRFGGKSERENNWSDLMDLIERWTLQRTGLECEQLFQTAGVPCSRYLTIAQALNDPQLATRGSLAKVKDGSGQYWVPSAPFQMPGLNISPRQRVPELGEDTVRVLTRLLAYTDGQAQACCGSNNFASGGG